MDQAVTTESHGKLACLNWQTLSDERAATVKANGKLRRAALIMTGKCNFACPYCKTLGGDRAPTRTKFDTMAKVMNMINHGLKELRLSGGEPTMISWLPELVAMAHSNGVRVAVSSNGYAPVRIYAALVNAGVAEFSISLDSTDPEEADRLAGGRKNVLARVERTIKAVTDMGAKVYIGMTCCASRRNPEEMKAIIDRVAALGATDVKIMSLAQEGTIVDMSWLDDATAKRFPFLAWRAHNFNDGRDVRGLREGDSPRCSLVLDDVTIAGDKHFPCNVYFREGGEAIGDVKDSATMLADRAVWAENHNSLCDPICKSMCMDLLRTYNNRVEELNT